MVIFTGAGISTESGIPDFRSPGGIWERFDPDDFTYEKFLNDDDARRKQWRLFREMGNTAEPNPAHLAIAELYHLGKLDCVITQNIDNLHQKAGIPGDKVLELHGNTQWLVCMNCGKRYSLPEIMDKQAENADPPDCEACHGILKPDVVFFGESLPEDVLNEAIKRACTCDLMIVIGSGLTVYPAAYLPLYTLEAGGKLVIINLSPTPMDEKATIVVKAKAGKAMSAIAHQVRDRLFFK
jgi:NAD-dependent deacetylase